MYYLRAATDYAAMGYEGAGMAYRFMLPGQRAPSGLPIPGEESSATSTPSPSSESGSADDLAGLAERLDRVVRTQPGQVWRGVIAAGSDKFHFLSRRPLRRIRVVVNPNPLWREVGNEAWRYLALFFGQLAPKKAVPPPVDSLPETEAPPPELRPMKMPERRSEGEFHEAVFGPIFKALRETSLFKEPSSENVIQDLREEIVVLRNDNGGDPTIDEVLEEMAGRLNKLGQNLTRRGATRAEAVDVADLLTMVTNPTPSSLHRALLEIAPTEGRSDYRDLSAEVDRLYVALKGLSNTPSLEQIPDVLSKVASLLANVKARSKEWGLLGPLLEQLESNLQGLQQMKTLDPKDGRFGYMVGLVKGDDDPDSRPPSLARQLGALGADRVCKGDSSLYHQLLRLQQNIAPGAVVSLMEDLVRPFVPQVQGQVESVPQPKRARMELQRLRDRLLPHLMQHLTPDRFIGWRKGMLVQVLQDVQETVKAIASVEKRKGAQPAEVREGEVLRALGRSRHPAIKLGARRTETEQDAVAHFTQLFERLMFSLLPDSRELVLSRTHGENRFVFHFSAEQTAKIVVPILRGFLQPEFIYPLIADLPKWLETTLAANASVLAITGAAVGATVNAVGATVYNWATWTRVEAPEPPARLLTVAEEDELMPTVHVVRRSVLEVDTESFSGLIDGYKGVLVDGLNSALSLAFTPTGINFRSLYEHLSPLLGASSVSSTVEEQPTGPVDPQLLVDVEDLFTDPQTPTPYLNAADSAVGLWTTIQKLFRWQMDYPRVLENLLYRIVEGALLHFFPDLEMKEGSFGEFYGAVMDLRHGEKKTLKSAMIVVLEQTSEIPSSPTYRLIYPDLVAAAVEKLRADTLVLPEAFSLKGRPDPIAMVEWVLEQNFVMDVGDGAQPWMKISQQKDEAFSHWFQRVFSGESWKKLTYSEMVENIRLQIQLRDER